MRLLGTLVLTLALVTVTAPMALGDGVAPRGAVVNGDFEVPFMPVDVSLPVQVPQECIGIGHQVLWGTETYQGDLTGRNGWFLLADAAGPEEDAEETVEETEAFADGSSSDPPGAPFVEPKPQEAPGRDPVEQATLQSGVGHCEFSKETGYDLVFLDTPQAEVPDKPSFWSEGKGNPVDFGYDFDDNPFDREAKIVAGQGSGHNIWQSYANSHQAFTGDFDELRFDVEAGSIPSSASIKLSLNMFPIANQTANPVVAAGSFHCDLSFGGLSADANGVVSLPAETGTFKNRSSACVPLEEEWNDASSAEEKKDILAQLRIIQLSFWNFNGGSQDVVIDNVAMENTATLAEGAARTAAP